MVSAVLLHALRSSALQQSLRTKTSKNCGVAVDAPYAGDIFVMRCDGADVCRLSEDGFGDTTLHTLGRQLRSCCTILKRSSSDGG
jgi:hypothetical protein